jgi:predicted glycosyltransferase
LAGAELEAALKAASVVICRSGYSTLMDLVALEKKAIIIPTPGQTEQEYLGTHLHEQGIFYCMEQDHLNLEIALREIESFPFRQFELEHPFEQFQPVLSSWLDTLDAISNARDAAREDAL